MAQTTTQETRNVKSFLRDLLTQVFWIVLAFVFYFYWDVPNLAGKLSFVLEPKATVQKTYFSKLLRQSLDRPIDNEALKRTLEASYKAFDRSDNNWTRYIFTRIEKQNAESSQLEKFDTLNEKLIDPLSLCLSEIQQNSKLKSSTRSLMIGLSDPRQLEDTADDASVPGSDAASLLQSLQVDFEKGNFLINSMDGCTPEIIHGIRREVFQLKSLDQLSPANLDHSIAEFRTNIDKTIEGVQKAKMISGLMLNKLAYQFLQILIKDLSERDKFKERALEAAYLEEDRIPELIDLIEKLSYKSDSQLGQIRILELNFVDQINDGERYTVTDLFIELLAPFMKIVFVVVIFPFIVRRFYLFFIMIGPTNS